MFNDYNDNLVKKWDYVTDLEFIDTYYVWENNELIKITESTSEVCNIEDTIKIIS